MLPKCPDFIVTSFMEYLDDAMRFHVFRYLSKPIDRQRLFRNLDDALVQYHAPVTKIAYETKDGVFTISPSSIVMIEAVSKKALFTHLRKHIKQSIHCNTGWIIFHHHSFSDTPQFYCKYGACI